VHEPVEDAIGQGGFTNLFMAPRNQQLGSQDRAAHLIASSQISQKSRRSCSESGAMVQSSMTSISMRLSRTSRLRRLPSARAIARSRNSDWARVYSADPAPGGRERLPAHLLIGSDAIQGAGHAEGARATDAQRGRDVSVSTDYNAKGARLTP
jgi:hypothetical protein